MGLIKLKLFFQSKKLKIQESKINCFHFKKKEMKDKKQDLQKV